MHYWDVLTIFIPILFISLLIISCYDVKHVKNAFRYAFMLVRHQMKRPRPLLFRLQSMHIHFNDVMSSLFPYNHRLSFVLRRTLRYFHVAFRAYFFNQFYIIKSFVLALHSCILIFHWDFTCIYINAIVYFHDFVYVYKSS